MPGGRKRTRTDTERVHRVLFKTHRQNARARGLSFELTFDQACKLFSQRCTYCNLYDWKCTNEGPGRPNLCVYATGIDRIDNTRGYTIDNVCSACKTCNFAKGTLSAEEWEQWLTAITAFRRRRRRVQKAHFGEGNNSP